MKKGYLALENGKVFSGYFVTDIENAAGEAVFTTGVVGYNNVLCDPCNIGQIVIQTFPLAGACGIIPGMNEQNAYPAAYVTMEIVEEPSNHNCQGKLSDYLNNKGVCALCGVDTREITRTLRDEGAMNAAIAKTPEEALNAAKAFKKVSKVGTACLEAYTLKAKAAQYNIAMISYGSVRDVAERLVDRRCNVTVLPYNTKSDEILNGGYDGVILSDGPGDPVDYAEQADEIKKIMGKLPIFACGLGHQLLAVANGMKTAPVKTGHRGANLPVRDLDGEKTYITHQNHGYTVSAETVDDSVAVISFINANDKDVEGIRYLSHPSFSVQFIPQDNSAPADTAFVYDRFVSMLGNN
ncbi:MAG: carbamoyl phosphate synthase small subunit [Clostridia bacterium]|nr:carbamoyl phosphate synthase small subunit [Clostridia bacterium]